MRCPYRDRLVVTFALLLALGAGACGDDKPFFQSVLVPPDSYDTVGPYRIEAYVVAVKGVRGVTVRLPSDSDPSSYSEVLATFKADSGEAELWLADLPGRPAGTVFSFYLEAVDKGGSLVKYPSGAPDELATFRILPSPEAQ
jgi:hypothetical protein